MELFLTYEESRYGGEPISDEPYSDHETAYIEWTPTGLYVTKPELTGTSRSWTAWYEPVTLNDSEVPIVGTTMYIGIVRYADGDTFGECQGYWNIVSCSANHDKAKNLLDAALVPRKPNSRDIYRPWEGYFSYLINSYVDTLILR
jgi:hypothetical protein